MAWKPLGAQKQSPVLVLQSSTRGSFYVSFSMYVNLKSHPLCVASSGDLKIVFEPLLNKNLNIHNLFIENPEI